MKTQQFSSSATSSHAAPPWYQRWEVWLPCSLVMAVILCVAAWIVAGVVSRRMYSDTVVELRAAGFPTTLADHHNDLVRRWQEERDAHPVVRHASVLPRVYRFRIALLWRQLLAMDGADDTGMRRWEAYNALDIHAIMFSLINRPEMAADAWMNLMRRPALSLEQNPAVSSMHLQILALLMRTGLFQEHHCAELHAMAMKATTADDVRRRTREDLRHEIVMLMLNADGYRKYGNRTYLFTMMSGIWAKPSEPGTLFSLGTLRALLPQELGLLEMRAALKDMAAYEQQLASQTGQPGISQPRLINDAPREMSRSFSNGSQYAMTHNMRLAILSFALWRARHPGRLPASLDDFLPSYLLKE